MPWDVLGLELEGRLGVDDAKDRLSEGFSDSAK